ncbi:precorrin-2 dehydrogenase/sirohydrochlorin ferrochelatase family protein [Desulfotruncus alcoholivorax]|uniref:precorrin-2 dehydrogenase/sirohydrochlorin ferrochelatase family protein n=1 Tax=Desulfotruncus alcoholivorax TaxID=265477 RepID=UPI0004014943|nr:bifunctional precorrin-2 dehydrogenase/sirohydrochlorin ferrochelatase [Desulfotruncus alcoholivorax]
MKHYPLFLDIKGKKCLVIGGGSVAERKVRSLLAYGAKVHVTSTKLNAALQEMVASGQVVYSGTSYRPAELDDACLVFCATNDQAVNSAVAKDCAGKNIPVNVVDQPSLCTFIVPSTVARGDLQLAISTGGKSPGMARALREKLEADFGPQFQEFIDYIGNIRNLVISNVEDQEQRSFILKNLVDNVTIDLVKQGELEQAKERVKNVYNPGGLKS